MTTLAKNLPRSYEGGEMNNISAIASDIIYRGAAVGIVKTSGHGRPLQAGDVFGGFCMEECDNSEGAAAAKTILVRKVGSIELAVSGAVITDIGQPIYATDDNTFVFSPVGGVFIGFITRFVSAGVVMVHFDAGNLKDPYLKYGSPEEYELISGAKTLDVEDNGKVIFVDTTAVVTLPAEATGIACTVVNIGAYGAVQISIDPAAADLIHAPDIGGTDNKDHINTLATSRRGDLCQFMSGLVSTGYTVLNQVGIWAQEA